MNTRIVKTWGGLISMLLLSVLQTLGNLSVLQTTGNEDTNLYYKVFAYGTLFNQVNPFAPPNNRDMKAELSSKAQAITWPPGSMAVMVWSDTDYLIVRNTHLNLRRILDATWQERVGVRIAVESTIIAFKSKDIENLQKEKGVSRDALFELIRRGRSEMISTARSITSSGYELIVQNTREIMYPDEQLYGANTNHFSGNVYVVLPEKFTSCEIGLILSAIGELGLGGFINVTVKSEWIELEKWEKHSVMISSKKGIRSTSVRMPVLNSSTVETQLRLTSGETVLLGGGKMTANDKVLYHFLKAEALPPENVR